MLLLNVTDNSRQTLAEMRAALASLRADVRDIDWLPLQLLATYYLTFVATMILAALAGLLVHLLRAALYRGYDGVVRRVGTKGTVWAAQLFYPVDKVLVLLAARLPVDDGGAHSSFSARAERLVDSGPKSVGRLINESSCGGHSRCPCPTH